MFACPGLIFYTVYSVPWLNGNLALAEKCSGPLRFRLRQVLLYIQIGYRNNSVIYPCTHCIFGIFHWHNPSGRTMALGLTQPLTEMTTRNISWGVKRGRCVGLTTLPLSCAECLKSESLNLLEHSGCVQACNGIALPLYKHSGRWQDVFNVWNKYHNNYMYKSSWGWIPGCSKHVQDTI